MKRRLRGNEKGFSLIELLAAVVIMGVLGIAIGGVLIQLQRANRITHEMTAVRQVQAAGDMVSLDGLQAQSIVMGSGMTDSAGFLQLSWIGEWTDDEGDYNLRARDITYYLEDEDGDGSFVLRRYEITEWTVDGDDISPGPTDAVVARNLDASEMSCEWTDTTGDGNPDTETFAFTVVSVVGTRTEERTYDIAPRPAN